MHHDNQVGGLTLISTNHFSIGATLRPRRGERVKEIYRRISCGSAAVLEYKKRGAGSTLLRNSSKGSGGAGPCGHGG
eukprot:357806-Prymnesium_polylepis.1